LLKKNWSTTIFMELLCAFAPLFCLVSFCFVLLTPAFFLHLQHLCLTQIKTMCIHEAKHPEVQFVMAVRAFPLYNNILSLWIFLGTLEPNST
jgi:hypothetical protein